MIGIIATINIKEGHSTDFEEIANQLVEKVTANEVGAIYYDLFKQDETTYVFLEKYKDQEALDIHRNTDYYKAIGTQLGAFMTNRPDIRILQSV